MAPVVGHPGRTTPVDNRRRLVVAGNGMAGTRAVEEILARGGAARYRITVFGDEPRGSHARLWPGHAPSGEEGPGRIVLDPLDWYRENGIRLHAGVRVGRIDRFARLVFSDDGRATPYDVLIIATGSRPLMPAIEGMYTPGGRLLPGVFAFRTRGDIRGIVSRAPQDRRRAVVIGGGPLGFAAAQDLQSHGVAVVRAGGHPDRRITAVLGGDKVRGVRLLDAPDIECDLLVVAAGIRPNVEVAVTSGLPVERAIVVDDTMRVPDEDGIFALGECAQHRGEVYSLVVALREQAAVLADHITEANPRSAFLGLRPSTELISRFP